MARNIDMWRGPSTRFRNPFALSQISPWWDDLLGERFLEDFFSPVHEMGEEMRAINPTCDVQETDTHYYVCFDMPGINKDDIRVETRGNQVTLSGERKTEDESHRTPYRSQRSYGHFRRTFTLPVGSEVEKIEANYRDGVLELSIPKGEAAKPRRINIGGGSPRLAGRKEKAA